MIVCNISRQKIVSYLITKRDKLPSFILRILSALWIISCKNKYYTLCMQQVTSAVQLHTFKRTYQINVRMYALHK